jgi:hypothetical protein
MVVDDRHITAHFVPKSDRDEGFLLGPAEALDRGLSAEGGPVRRGRLDPH